jgi:hypothetical protein
MAAAIINWVQIALGQYIDEDKLKKVLLEKARANGSSLKIPDFQIHVSKLCLCRTLGNARTDSAG